MTEIANEINNRYKFPIYSNENYSSKKYQLLEMFKELEIKYKNISNYEEFLTCSKHRYLEKEIHILKIKINSLSEQFIRITNMRKNNS